jgi:hypothetical protein
VAQTVTIPLTLSKSTKGTHVFANEDKGITGVYVPKALLPTPPPSMIALLLPSLDAQAPATDQL